MNYTFPIRGDGFGAQFQTIIQSIVIIETAGDNYVHTPIVCMEHNYDKDPNFLSKVEELMNVKDYYFIKNNKPIEQIVFGSIIGRFEENIDYYISSQSMTNLKLIFRNNKKNYYDNYINNINVAVHIRRPNCYDNRIEGTDTPDSYYIDIINKIREKYKNSNKKPIFHIYSQGKECDFNSYINYDVIFHINKDLFNTFTELVYADILVMSASSFSYSAALLSDGEIYYHNFWHKPSINWIV